MPIRSLWRSNEPDAAEENEAEIEELNERLVKLASELELYDTEAWKQLEAMLLEEQRQAFTDLMSGEGEAMILARERAKVYAKLLSKPQGLREEQDRLRSIRSELAEE